MEKQKNSEKMGRRYDRDFKRDAVALVQGGKTITEVSRSLGVSYWSHRSKVIKRCPASSGNVGSQKSSEQDKQGKGPTPEGKYKIDLRPDGNRTAPVNPETGDLRAAKGGGVDKIPDEGKTSNGGSYTYPGWGKNRALLEPEKGTDTKKRSNFYVHDSEKGAFERLHCMNLGHPLLSGLWSKEWVSHMPMGVSHADATRPAIEWVSHMRSAPHAIHMRLDDDRTLVLDPS